MLQHFGKMAFCLGFLAIASQGGDDAVNNLFSKIDASSKSNKPNLKKRQEERMNETKKMEEEKKKCEHAFNEVNLLLKKEEGQIKVKEGPLYDSYNHDEKIKKFDKLYEELREEKSNVAKKEAEAQKTLIECVKKATRKNGPKQFLEEKFHSLKDPQCKDVTLIEPKMNNFSLYESR